MASERPTVIAAGELDALKRALKDRRGGPLPVPYIAVTLEEYCLILALLDENAKLTAWQPIETAPIGVDLCLYWPPDRTDGHYVIGRGEARTNWETKPTHWMPLPVPPQEAKFVDRGARRASEDA